MMGFIWRVGVQKFFGWIRLDSPGLDLGLLGLPRFKGCAFEDDDEYEHEDEAYPPIASLQPTMWP